ncbi:kinase-like protein [Stemphylium lycopersici]|uniref:Kinase-like protein n=1 Tax=Stemphylium lycopersici TaxID=183478 RepID=A0A364MXH4_STELY|nr:kinase-like protein [Stemphylium lycopersici]RAR06458.1 kinase-like protein [Stemphylium lycopersici]RAR07711.1 kinase-like protein [Stemphylium lycopersici]
MPKAVRKSTRRAPSSPAAAIAERPRRSTRTRPVPDPAAKTLSTNNIRRKPKQKARILYTRSISDVHKDPNRRLPLFTLSLELLKAIAETYLPLESALSLSLTCKEALSSIGSWPWAAFKKENRWSATRTDFLQAMIRDWEAQAQEGKERVEIEFCVRCNTLHSPLPRRSQHRKRGLTTLCFGQEACIDYLSQKNPEHDQGREEEERRGYSLVYPHIQSALSLTSTHAQKGSEASPPIAFLSGAFSTSFPNSNVTVRLSSSARRVDGNLIIRHEHVFQATRRKDKKNGGGACGALCAKDMLQGLPPIYLCPHQTTDPSRPRESSRYIKSDERNSIMFTHTLVSAFPTSLRCPVHQASFRKPTRSEVEAMASDDDAIFCCRSCPTKYTTQYERGSDGNGELRITSWHCFGRDELHARRYWKMFVRREGWNLGRDKRNDEWWSPGGYVPDFDVGNGWEEDIGQGPGIVEEMKGSARKIQALLYLPGRPRVLLVFPGEDALVVQAEVDIIVNRVRTDASLELGIRQYHFNLRSTLSASPTIMNPKHGLLWEDHPWTGLTPKWAVNPSVDFIAEIVRRELNVRQSDPCVVEFLAEGAFNKVYTITCGDKQDYIVRVSLPVEPHFKTMSEAATIEYIRHHTDIPAPQVFRSQATNDNELQFEWMLMERIPGSKLSDRWRDMSWLKKEVLVRKAVSHAAQLFKPRFNRLGNLYSTKELQKLSSSNIPDVSLLGAEASTDSTNFCLSKVVSMPFFWGKRADRNVLRGPFKSSKDWLAAQLQLQILDLEDKEFDEDDPDEDDPEVDKRRAQRLLGLLPNIFPDEGETFVVHHNDLNQANILLNDNDDLVGILDWECVHTAPLWLACQMPKFLEHDMERDEPPNPDEFPTYTRDDGTDDRSDMYYRRLDEYEKTQLWRFFLEEMQRVCPEWVRVYKSEELKVGLDQLLSCFGVGLYDEEIDRWMHNVEKNGASPTLRDILRSRQKAIDNWRGGPLVW